jgi:tetratricopeptide (TPR) repeat protein
VDEAVLGAGGRISDLNVPVHHYGALGFVVRREKGLRYLRLGKAKVTKSPEDPRAWYELGVQAYEIGELDEGQDAFLRTLDLCREEAGRSEDIVQNAGFRPDMVHVMLGAIAYRRGDPTRASRHYCQALEINPEAYEAHLNLGIVLEEKGRAPEAFRHYQRVLEIRPGETIAQNRLTCLTASHSGG